MSRFTLELWVVIAWFCAMVCLGAWLFGRALHQPPEVYRAVRPPAFQAAKTILEEPARPDSDWVPFELDDVIRQVERVHHVRVFRSAYAANTINVWTGVITLDSKAEQGEALMSLFHEVGHMYVMDVPTVEGRELAAWVYAKRTFRDRGWMWAWDVDHAIICLGSYYGQ